MAVSVEDLAIALRVSDDGSGLDVGTIGLLTRLLGVGDSHVALLIPSAPEPIQDEVRIRLAAYLYDQPIGRRDAYANAWVNSGAGGLAARWLNQRVAGGPAPAPGPGGGGGGLTPEKIYTSDGLIGTAEDLFTTTLDVEAWYQILLKNDRGLTPMISGKFIDGLANNDPVYVRGWLRGSATGYLEFYAQKNGANIIFGYYGPLSTINLQTNLEIWKFS